MSKFKKRIIPEEKVNEIIEYFKTENNNTMKELSNKFGYSTYLVGRVITEYYESIKKNK